MGAGSGSTGVPSPAEAGATEADDDNGLVAESILADDTDEPRPGGGQETSSGAPHALLPGLALGADSSGGSVADTVAPTAAGSRQLNLGATDDEGEAERGAPPEKYFLIW